MTAQTCSDAIWVALGPVRFWVYEIQASRSSGFSLEAGVDARCRFGALGSGFTRLLVLGAWGYGLTAAWEYLLVWRQQGLGLFKVWHCEFGICCLESRKFKGEDFRGEDFMRATFFVIQTGND